MTRDQAKQVLLAYRPESSDREDPEIAEALELVRKDKPLEEWLRGQKAFHESVRTQLRDISPPAGLRERILARPRVVVPLWRRPEFLLMAACLGLGLIMAALWMPSAPKEETFALFRSRMVGFALRVYRMDIETNNLSQVRQYLVGKGAPVVGQWYTVSVYLRSEGAPLTLSLGLEDSNGSNVIIDNVWRRYYFTFQSKNAYSASRMFQIYEWTPSNTYWEFYGPQTEAVNNLTASSIAATKEATIAQYIPRMYKTCLDAGVPYMSIYSWREQDPATPGFGGVAPIVMPGRGDAFAAL